MPAFRERQHTVEHAEDGSINIERNGEFIMRATQWNQPE